MSNKVIHKFACGHTCQITKAYAKKLAQYEHPERVMCYQCQQRRRLKKNYRGLP